MNEELKVNSTQRSNDRRWEIPDSVRENASGSSAGPVSTVGEAVGRSSLGHLPCARWEFDEAVTTVFDDMLARSIPQIDGMREVVFQVASHLAQTHTDIVDLGCARGEAMARLVAHFGDSNHFVGIEASPSMAAASRLRFKNEIAAGTVEIRCDDLRYSYPAVNASVTLCVLTLQFTPLEHRVRILADAFERTTPGGTFLLVEKVLGEDAKSHSLLADLYYQHKRAAGYSQEEIDRKKLALEGVLVPVTAAWNEQLLRGAGYRHVESIWRYLNFCGWMAIKE